MSLPVRLLLALFLAGASSQAQQGSAPEATHALETAIHRLTEAEKLKTRFTRLKLEHHVEYDGTGAKVYDTHKLYEDTWIHELEYSRLLEVEGEPLKGVPLAEEQARFDQAVADRKALSDEERAKLTGGRVYFTLFKPEDVLTPAYKITELNEADCGGQPCHVFQAERVLSKYEGRRVPPIAYRVWITEVSPFAARLEFDTTADHNGMLKGTSDIFEFQIFDDVPVLQHSRLIGSITVHGNHWRLDTEDTYTRYRRFTTSVTIKSGDGASLPSSPRP